MKSMTGFGRAEAANKGWRCTVEMAAVNRKQSDIVITLPRDLTELESDLRQLVIERLSRGRVAITIRLEPATRQGATTLEVNEALAAQYLAALTKLTRAAGKKIDLEIEAGDLLRAPGVFTLRETAVAPTEVRPLVTKAFKLALDRLDKARATEGAALLRDLQQRLQALAKLRAAILKEAPRVVANYRASLHRRLKDAGLPIALEDERLVREIGLFAERCDIHEELSRFESHLDQFHATLRGKEPGGRKLDFLCQELLRELNTTTSKANDAAISHLAVTAKTEVEKLREQVQNVE